MEEFNEKEAFLRNIGLLSEEEQKRLKDFTIAIPGTGGMGGQLLISFVRQGFEKFKISDFDKFELKNFNRQYGATIDSLGKPKIDTMKKIALSINPKCKIETFSKGITKENAKEFLKNVDLLADGLDFFEIDIRRELFNKALKNNIPVISAGPIGFGCAYIIFLPKGPNFDKYFGIDNKTPADEKILRFGLGVAPKMLQRKYMKRVKLKSESAPSSISGVELSAGIATINAIKILLKKGDIKPVPYFHQFDAMLNKYICKKKSLWKNNPLLWLKIKIAKRIYFK